MLDETKESRISQKGKKGNETLTNDKLGQPIFRQITVSTREMAARPPTDGLSNGPGLGLGNGLI